MSISGAFLKIDDIVGESQRDGMEGSIDVLSYSFGVQNTGSASAGGGAGAGRADFTDVSLVVPQSTATVPLLLAVATGKHHQTAVLTLRNNQFRDFYEVTLTDVVVTSVHEGASVGSDDRPTNAVSLSFQKVQWSYRAHSTDGSLGTPVVGGWDLATNTQT